MSKAEIFLDEYKKLEQSAVDRFGFRDDGRAVSQLMKIPSFREIREELQYCKEVRNLLSHNPKIDGVEAVIPSDQIIALLKRTREKVEHPLTASGLGVPLEKVYTCSMEDPVLPAIEVMHQNVYTHVPIIKKGVVIGVFSENTLISWLLDRGSVFIGKERTFSDLRDYLPIECHRAESFRFISGSETLASIRKRFQKAYGSDDRIGMLFVTANGKADGKLQRIITAWDIASVE